MARGTEDREVLPRDARQLHLALRGLVSELEAVDWYVRRAVTGRETTLIGELAPSREEEMERAAVSLEWLRRHLPGWDAILRRVLFCDGPLPGAQACGDPGEEGVPTYGLGLAWREG
jgi:uncharacterized protein